MRVIATATDLAVSFGSTMALQASSFDIPTGRVTAVIGPNGSGKSTLLNALAGLVSPADGSIRVDAEASRIAYVLQGTRVNEALPITVQEVVMMGRYATAGSYGRLNDADRNAVTEAMERMGITDIAHRHLHDLSGGQRQRAFVAQGLAQDHDLLLLDEPLTGIDLPTAQAIDAVIHDETSRGCSVVMTTHDLSEAQIADHVILLAGRVIVAGDPAEVLTTEHLVAAYGSALLHVDDGGGLLLDDPGHAHLPGRHVHRERTIHTEVSPGDHHPEPH